MGDGEPRGRYDLRAFDLTGRTAIVSGAAGLLGPQHAGALADCGAVVIVTDVDEPGLEKVRANLAAIHGAAVIAATRMDVTDSDSIAAAREWAEREYGGVDILINNAAIDPKVTAATGLAKTGRLEDFPIESWNLQLSVGLTGAFLCSRDFGARMASRGRGVILNIASDLSVIAPDQRLYRQEGRAPEQQPVKPATYSVIKAGLVGLTRYLASYWADQGVRANALSPGGVYAQQPEEFVRRISNLIPLGRMAEQTEYRAAVQFLCSDASRYMTGQNLVIDGGRSVL